MTEALTCGIHHFGLAVPDLEAAVGFFLGALGREVVARNDENPSALVSDGSITLTLWRVADPATVTSFDRRANIGLHHLALAVVDERTLVSTFEAVAKHPGIVVEFAPGPMRSGTDRKHFIVAMPGGLRLGFACRG